jgi:hypothetical protein
MQADAHKRVTASAHLSLTFLREANKQKRMHERVAPRETGSDPRHDGRGRFPSCDRPPDWRKNTIVKLLENAGGAFCEYQDRTMRNLTCEHLQVDEAWAFCYAKQKNVASAKRASASAGDIWTWAAIDAATKLVPSWYVGARDSTAAQHFIGGLVPRITGWRNGVITRHAQLESRQPLPRHDSLSNDSGY